MNIFFGLLTFKRLQFIAPWATRMNSISFENLQCFLLMNVAALLKYVIPAQSTPTFIILIYWGCIYSLSPPRTVLLHRKWNMIWTMKSLYALTMRQFLSYCTNTKLIPKSDRSLVTIHLFWENCHFPSNNNIQTRGLI